MITDLLKAEGFGPRMGFTGFSAAIWAAEAIAQTIESPIRRAQFEADIAAELARLDYQPFEGLEDLCYRVTEDARWCAPSRCGSTELWGAIAQRIPD